MDAYKVNLLPRQLQREGLIDIRRLAVMVGAALPAAVVLGCYIIFLINFGFVKDQLAETRSQSALLAPAAARAEEIIKARAEMEGAIGEFDDIIKNRKSWSGLMNDLGSIAPADLWLTGLEISNKPSDAPPDNGQKEPDPFARSNQVSCKGIAGTLSSVGVFVRNLNGLPYFEEVKLVKVNAVSEGLEFEIMAVLKDEG